jgi:capsular polysaccharide biosynthesis protein
LGKWRVENVKQPTLARTYVKFEKLLVIIKNIKTGLVTVQMDWPDSAKAASWLNELVRRLNVEMRFRAIASADAAVGYLQKELTSTQDVNTREAIGRLMETQIRQRMLANVTQEYALRVIDKATPADPFERVWPKKLVLIGIGLLVGLLIGLSVVSVLELRSKYRDAYP